jgi:MFS family permease
MTETIDTQRKKYGWFTKLAVLGIIACEYTIATTNPALGAIANAMPDVDTVLIRQIQTLPSLTLIIVALLEPLLEKLLRKKTLVIIAACVMLVAGVAPAFGGNIYVILACRALYGAGRGIIFPMAMAFIVELFDGKERDEMMGYRSATGNIMSLIFLNLGGFLASIFWRYAFFGVLMMIPIIILLIFKLPNPEKENAERYARIKAEEANKTKKAKLQPKTWFMIIANMIFMLFLYVFLTDVAINVAAAEIGTPQTAATIMTVFTLSSIVMGLAFGKVIRPIFKRFAVCFGLVFLAASNIIIANWMTLPGFICGAICYGFGFSVYNTAMYLDLAKTAHPTAAAQTLSWFMAFNAFGQFMEPNVIGWLAKLFGLNTEARGFILAWPVLTAVAVGTIVVKLIRKPGMDYADQVLLEAEGKVAGPASAEESPEAGKPTE